ncbi:type II secretion system F family protein [Corynebacterium pygosceleis]|uniref:type II secretion system F family protein n=1 Tax=Corynebacterium pygosceleis TaxID=2800406 RepID=UPI002003EA29|nr:type II secretion system F family protein [Corynebacterium pygosceleis]MCK7676030.1 type II secretion system F family protein [Corynebacterium pygosceleis]
MIDPLIWATPPTLIPLAAALLCSAPAPARRIHTDTGHTPKQPRDRPAPASPLEVAADIELFAACTTAGLPVETAIRAVADTACPATAESWRRAGALIAVGAPVTDAWRILAQTRGIDDLARAALRSGDSGAAIVAGCERAVHRLREESADRATGTAERAGVLIALPLTLCFLPAFILLGLVPIILSLGGQLLG